VRAALHLTWQTPLHASGAAGRSRSWFAPADSAKALPGYRLAASQPDRLPTRVPCSGSNGTCRGARRRRSALPPAYVRPSARWPLLSTAPSTTGQSRLQWPMAEQAHPRAVASPSHGPGSWRQRPQLRRRLSCAQQLRPQRHARLRGPTGTPPATGARPSCSGGVPARVRVDQCSKESHRSPYGPHAMLRAELCLPADPAPSAAETCIPLALTPSKSCAAGSNAPGDADHVFGIPRIPLSRSGGWATRSGPRRWRRWSEERPRHPGLRRKTTAGNRLHSKLG